MLPTERREQIRRLVKKRRNVKISELSQELQVSEMTIYRDLKPMLEEGWMKKTYGGVTLVQEPETSPVLGCICCGRQPDPRLTYRLVLMDQRIETACCSHCGLLRHQQIQDEVIQAICQDFFTNTTVSAMQAWYVMETEVDLRCCQPQVLSFEQKHTAEKFVRGFGGIVLSFAEAMTEVYRKMKQDSCSCHDSF
ncbi:DeoR family transcriptional regulator [Melghirimyces algeriensis]|uniref:DNA-binding transcriptional regulator of sugar metabolism, DeoR/GlpR family n=1 Tax=Melghirimyces algeriensis TaxID=910412 RepID=A0A521C162_9BACL|nr:DeoR family transcriptional regulator [Melghirimyces algeriensis]SMO53118.1 DNA-binding transcriptional regulator of sugar metabolism, DeoR/GlpR family [Melghirimyces algeriensis]